MLAPSSVLSRHILVLLRLDQGTSPLIDISPLFLLDVTSTILGSLIRVRCFRELGPFFTFTLAINSRHKLVTTGPYYTGLGLIVAGITMCEASAGSWWRAAGMLSTLWIMVTVSVENTFLVVSRVQKEDLMLKCKFGEVWEQYAKRVPYR